MKSQHLLDLPVIGARQDRFGLLGTIGPPTTSRAWTRRAIWLSSRATGLSTWLIRAFHRRGVAEMHNR